MAKISCVMPTRDRDEIISDAIKSIINQTFKDWELIIVDDHSLEEDKTEEVVKSFNDERIKYYKLTDENGKGISAARNFGNAVAKGEFIAVMDSDDVSRPERFEHSLNELEKTGADFVYGELELWNPTNDVSKIRDKKYRSIPFDSDELAKRCYIPHVACIYKRSVALDFPYNSFFRRAEDYDFFLRLAKNNCNFSFLNEVLTKYRIHDDSVTRRGSDLFDYDEKARSNYLNL